MNLADLNLNCQLPGLQKFDEGPGETPPESLARRVKLAIRRRLNPSRERAFKNFTNHFLNRISRFAWREPKPAPGPAEIHPPQLQAGDWVRVRTLEEIRATLNHWRQLKGCTFMPEMAQFCGSTQRVLKPMNRFVDERDLRVKRSTGIVLLEGLLCQGTADFGNCDRSCFYFWRTEWLEKIG